MVFYFSIFLYVLFNSAVLCPIIASSVVGSLITISVSHNDTFFNGTIICTVLETMEKRMMINAINLYTRHTIYSLFFIAWLTTFIVSMYLSMQFVKQFFSLVSRWFPLLPAHFLKHCSFILFIISYKQT